MSINAYPLQWPTMFPRSPRRENGKFQTSLSGALKNVDESLRRFAADSAKKIEGLVISSNVTLGAHRPGPSRTVSGARSAERLGQVRSRLSVAVRCDREFRAAPRRDHSRVALSDGLIEAHT